LAAFRAALREGTRIDQEADDEDDGQQFDERKAAPKPRMLNAEC